MLKLFETLRGKIVERDLAPRSRVADRYQQLSRAVWIDLQEPGKHERVLLKQMLRTELPDSESVEEIESSARYFIDSAGIHIHSLYPIQSEGRHKTTTVAFILQPHRLITVRDAEVADFYELRMRVRLGQIEAYSAREMLIQIFEQKVESLADALEAIHLRLGEVSHQVLEEEGAELQMVIEQLAELEDNNGKMRLCLMDTQRSMVFLLRNLKGSSPMHESCRGVARDIDTLMSHTTFLFEKINFLMDSTQGFINIEQNKITKIFSIAAVVFLPPTLIASIYGMNFMDMPELRWLLGYPWALGLMLLAGVAPYWYFKRKKWL